VLALGATGAEAQTRLRLPFDDPKGTLFMLQPIVHVDHDPVDKPLAVECVNYKGLAFPWCYDEHRGTDFLLKSSFGTMDANDVRVIAAADGVVTKTVDGNYDRCHGQLGLTVSCDGHPIKANRVELQHADGLTTSYLHLKKGSVKVTKGQSVACGALLGYVGSSGNSAMPHLHFELRSSSGAWLDPFAGAKSQPSSYWVQQAGAFSRPAPRCKGEPLPLLDAGIDAAVPAIDAGATGKDAHMADAGLALTQRGGCSVDSEADVLFWPLIWGFLLVALWLRRLQRKPVSPSAE
jgi:Peptidase family M23